MPKRSLVCSLALSLLITLPVAAQNQANAPDPNRGPALPEVAANSPSGRFGGKGQLAISSDAGLSISNTSISGVDGSSTQLVLRPAVDYFVIDYLSVGGFLGLEYNSAPGGSSTALSVGPRVGYDIPLSERFSFWPKVGFSFASTSQKQDAVRLPDGATMNASDRSSTSVQLNLFAPLMFHGSGPAMELWV